MRKKKVSADSQAKATMYERAMEEALACMVAGRHKWKSRVVDRVVLAVDLFEYLGAYPLSKHVRDYKLAKECGDRVLARSGLPVSHDGWRILPPLPC